MSTIAIIAGCILLNALLSAFEMAFVAVNRPRLRRMAREGHAGAERLLALRDNPERTLSLIQIGITAVAALSAAVGGAGAAESIEPWIQRELGIGATGAEVIAIFLVVVPLTYLTVVAGELVPKALALRDPARLALAGTPIIRSADLILSPVVSVLEESTKLIVRLFHRPGKHPAKTHGEHPQIVELDELSEAGRRYVLNMARLEQAEVGDVTVPWTSVVHLRESDPAERLMELFNKHRHTRLPVVRDGEAIGLINTKEFIAYRDGTGASDWQRLIRPIQKLRESESLLASLRRMQRAHSPIGVVYNASDDGVRGIITVEDILEEVVGELYDEDDDQFLRKLLASRARTKFTGRHSRSG